MEKPKKPRFDNCCCFFFCAVVIQFISFLGCWRLGFELKSLKAIRSAANNEIAMLFEPVNLNQQHDANKGVRTIVGCVCCDGNVIKTSGKPADSVIISC